MFNKLIKEYEEVSSQLSELDWNASVDNIFYLQGVKQGIVNCMNIVDFKATCDYFNNSDDLPY